MPAGGYRGFALVQIRKKVAGGTKVSGAGSHNGARQKRPKRSPQGILSVLLDELIDLVHVFFGADEERDALVKVGGLNVQDVFFAV